MSTDITIRDTDAVTKACAAYAAETQASAIAGDLLAFRKGVWQRGEGKETVDTGVTFVANMAEIWRGWIRWRDGTPADHRLVRVGEQAADRNDLGHFDEAKWEIGNDGNPRDPWSMTDRIVLRESGDEELSLLTFSTGSYGGRQALGKLCKLYAQRAAEHADAYPVVQLSSGTWKHKTYGDIPRPVFDVVGWEQWDAKESRPPPREPLPDGDPNDAMPDFAS